MLFGDQNIDRAGPILPKRTSTALAALGWPCALVLHSRGPAVSHQYQDVRRASFDAVSTSESRRWLPALLLTIDPATVICKQGARHAQFFHNDRPGNFWR